ncbi:AAA family ATPase [Deinococcus taklimakanensis]|uniref:AAA family ATPase n=1 Tax=Deinococcus taklimakanensis TaxID=536443 RepID=A0ABW5P104_9DEIO
MEILKVKGFTGIKKAEIRVQKFTVFIGHQASGKSICAKLIYYFRQIISGMALDISSGTSKIAIKKKHKVDFARYFPQTAWGREAFEIDYQLYDFKVKIKSKNTKAGRGIDITYSKLYDDLLDNIRKEVKKHQDDEFDGYYRLINVDGREEYVMISPATLVLETARKMIHEDYSNTNYFVPAGRSFFSTLRGNVFSFISTSIDMDPFLIEFGRLYERMRNIYNNSLGSHAGNKDSRDVFNKIIKGDYKRENGDDYIFTNGDRSVPISSTSSGQQEALPLLILLSTLRNNRARLGVNLFIEEPEAHLFPDTQKEFIDYIFTSLSRNVGICVITTHSPYILSEINNMMYRGSLVGLVDNERRIKMSADPLVDPKKVEAYHFKDGEVTRIIDSATGLIDASSIDEASEVITKDFDQLMEIESGLMDV